MRQSRIFLYCSRLLLTLMAALALAACERTRSPDELLTEARAAIERNDNQTAVIQLKNALQQDSGNSAARYELGRVYMRADDSLSAVKELSRALDAGYPADSAVPLLARAMVDAKDGKRALERFGDTRLATATAQADLKAALGHAYLAGGNRDAARAAFDEALAIDPSHAYGNLGLARFLGTGRDFAAAQQLVDTLLAADPENVDAWYLDAELKTALGHQDPALASFRKVYEIKPSNITARFVVISTLANQNRVKEARDELAALRKQAPKAPEVNYLDGLLLVKEGKFVEARDRLNKTLAAAPSYLPALALAALTEFELKSYALAEQHAEKVIANGGDSLLVRKVLIGVYLQSGRLDKARQTLAPLLKANPQSPDVQGLAGLVYLTGGDTKGAEAAFAEAARQQPDDAEAQSRLGLSRIAAGDSRGGIGALELAAKLDDAGGRSDIVLIAAHLRNRDADRALAAIDALEKKRPADAMSTNLRGTAYLMKNDSARARAEFVRALEFNPAFFAAASNLARMDIVAGKMAEAEATLRRVADVSPDNSDALLSLAGLLARTAERLPEAVALLRKAIDQHPKLAAPRIALIELYQLNGDRGKALAAANEAANALPDEARILEALAAAQARAGEFVAAMNTRARLVERDPSSARALLNLAATQMAAKREVEAIQSVRKVLVLQPEMLEAQRMLISIHRSRNAVDDALRVAREVQRQRPKEAVGFLLEGELMLGADKPESAVKAYREALSRERSAANVTGLHSALLRAGNAREAQALADVWIKENPKDAVVALYLGDVALAQKRFDEARVRYESVLSRAPDNAIALNNLAWIAARSNDARARSYAEKAYAKAPRNPAVLDTYGSILVSAGEVERGLKMMRDAVGIAPAAHDLRLSLARSLVVAGYKGDARKELEPLVALGSKYERAAEVADLMKTL